MNDPSGPRPSILLVNDHIRTAPRMAQLLRDDGFDVELVVDVAAAGVRLGRAPAPDVVVVDVRGSHSAGMVVVRLARAGRAHMPTLLIAGDPSDAPRAARSASDSTGEPALVVLTRPVDHGALHARIRATLGCVEVASG